MGDDVLLVKKSRVRKALISKEEKNLLIKSSICDRNTKLKEILSLFKGRIEIKHLDEIKDRSEEIYRMIKTKEAVVEMVNAASMEWTPKEYKGKMRIPCQLCGSIKSEIKFNIINRINNNHLLVGSSCIFKFEKIDHKIYGITLSQVEKCSRESPNKLARIVHFNELFPGGATILDDFKNKYNQFEIIFPKDFDEDFDRIIHEARKIYNSYISGKSNDDQLKYFKGYLTDFDYLYNKCKRFCNKNNDNNYICSKKMAALLEENNLKGILDNIKENGIIDKDMARYVYHIDFVNKFRENIENEFRKYNIILDRIDSQSIKFSYKYKSLEPIILESNLKDFTYKCSNIFFNKSEFNRKDTFEVLNINKSYSNVYEFIGILEVILKETGYYFQIDEELHEKQRVELYKNGYNKFATLDLGFILDKYEKVLYLDTKNSKALLVDNINNISNWSLKTDKEKYDVGNISETWAK